MLSQRVEHPLHTRDMTNLFDVGIGRKVQSDALGTVVRGGEQPKGVMKAEYALSNRQKKAPWRTHQSLAHDTKVRCCWEKCPGLKTIAAKRPRLYDTVVRCEECSILYGKSFFFVIAQRAEFPVFVTLHFTISIIPKSTNSMHNNNMSNCVSLRGQFTLPTNRFFPWYHYS